MELVSGISHLAYVVIFNITSTLNTNTGVGSLFNNLIGAGGFANNNRIQAALELSTEIGALEQRIKLYQKQSPTTLSADQTLQSIDLVNMVLDYTTQTVSLELKIYNGLGQGVIVSI
jgi:hypothetical protein